MAFRQAWQAGRLDPFEMLAEMPSELMDWWEAWLMIEPQGQPAEDARHARRCGIATGEASGRFLYRPPVQAEIPRRQTAAEQKATMRGQR
ncbi:MAG: hypothetical protein JXL80_17570 [Planctomycetes bacterium]|nr:hypothetical protein [Planctomycetota bacterium]